MKLSQKIVTTVLLLANILLMFMNWFGGYKGVQEIRGTIVLASPVTIICIVIILIGLWVKKAEKIFHMCVYGGFTGIICTEIYYFFTWCKDTISLNSGLIKSIHMVQPVFYVGLMLAIASLVTAVLFGYCQYKQDEQKTTSVI